MTSTIEKYLALSSKTNDNALQIEIFSRVIVFITPELIAIRHSLIRGMRILKVFGVEPRKRGDDFVVKKCKAPSGRQWCINIHLGVFLGLTRTKRMRYLPKAGVRGPESRRGKSPIMTSCRTGNAFVFSHDDKKAKEFPKRISAQRTLERFSRSLWMWPRGLKPICKQKQLRHCQLFCHLSPRVLRDRISSCNPRTIPHSINVKLCVEKTMFALCFFPAALHCDKGAKAVEIVLKKSWTPPTQGLYVSYKSHFLSPQKNSQLKKLSLPSARALIKPFMSSFFANALNASVSFRPNSSAIKFSSAKDLIHFEWLSICLHNFRRSLFVPEMANGKPIEKRYRTTVVFCQTVINRTNQSDFIF